MIGGLLMVLLFLASTFLILLVLIQRGRGGGLAGAFGGLGGQSAFGTKAGDLFTRITIGVAAAWILLCAASVKYFSDTSSSLLAPNLGQSASTAPGAAGGAAKKDDKAGATGAATTPPAKSGEAPSGAAPTGATPPSGEAKPSESTTAPATPAPSESGTPEAK